MPTSRPAAAATPDALRGEIGSFLDACRRPALLEPGMDPLPLAKGAFTLTCRGAFVLLEAWDDERTFARRVTHVVERRGARLRLGFERLRGGAGVLTLVDLEDARTATVVRRNRQDSLAAQFAGMLARQFPEWRAEGLTAGADLEHTLSPAYPRALLRRQQQRMAALCAPPGGADGALTFGLIWLEHLRRREAPRPVGGLVLFLARGEEGVTRLRVRGLDAARARIQIMVYAAEGEQSVELEDTGNVWARLDPWRPAGGAPECIALRWARRVSLEPGVEAVEAAGGALSLRVAGLEFARAESGALRVGVGRRRRARSWEEAAALARELAAARLNIDAAPPHPLASAHPEARLESLVRAHLADLDPRLRPEPVYGQAGAVAGRDRGMADLLAIGHDGRLAVIELKASEDPHLPMQALDYWLRMRHHAVAGEFAAAGYFPGLAVRTEAPRLLLVAPAVHFHPTTETLLSFFPSDMQVERIGLGVEWQRSFRVILRLEGARRPEWPASPPVSP